MGCQRACCPEYVCNSASRAFWKLRSENASLAFRYKARTTPYLRRPYSRRSNKVSSWPNSMRAPRQTAASAKAAEIACVPTILPRLLTLQFKPSPASHLHFHAALTFVAGPFAPQYTAAASSLAAFASHKASARCALAALPTSVASTTFKTSAALQSSTSFCNFLTSYLSVPDLGCRRG
eukprot:2927793-Pleurochrysis_carterae.AAC.2